MKRNRLTFKLKISPGFGECELEINMEIQFYE